MPRDFAFESAAILFFLFFSRKNKKLSFLAVNEIEAYLEMSTLRKIPKFNLFPSVEILWKSTVSVDFRANRSLPGLYSLRPNVT